MEPGDRIRLIRQLAEHLGENEDWIHIDLILREFGFDTEANWPGGSEYNYALEMLSRGRDADLHALHTHLFGFSAGETGDTVDSDVWTEGQFRLFLSHISVEKAFASVLKTALERFGISSFVAHQDIRPTRQWVEEIERALATCDALAAVLHKDFGASDWTDQEVGFCHGRRTLIVPIKIDIDPYGFISRYQAVNGRGKTPDQIAAELYSILVAHPKTSAEMADAIVRVFENSPNFAAAKRNIGLLRDIEAWTPPLLRRLENAGDTNDQIRDAWGVTGQIRTILRENGASYGEPETADSDDLLPF